MNFITSEFINRGTICEEMWNVKNLAAVVTGFTVFNINVT